MTKAISLVVAVSYTYLALVASTFVVGIQLAEVEALILDVVAELSNIGS